MNDMMSKRFFKMLLSSVFPFLMVIALSGCGNPKTTGKVTFPDGTPLTTGTVCFETSEFAFYGDLKPNGTYSMGKTEDGQGIPPGEYKVRIQGAQLPDGLDSDGNVKYKPLIDAKFSDASTSGLTCTVDGKTQFDFQVTPP